MQKSDFLGTHWCTDHVSEHALEQEEVYLEDKPIKIPSAEDLMILAVSPLCYGWRFHNGGAISGHQAAKITSREQAIECGMPPEVCDILEASSFDDNHPEPNREFTWDRLNDYLLCNPIAPKFLEDPNDPGHPNYRTNWPELLAIYGEDE